MSEQQGPPQQTKDKIMSVDYKTAITAVKAGETLELTEAELTALNEVAKAKKAKRIPAEAVTIKQEIAVKEKKTVGRPKGEPKFCSDKSHGDKPVPSRSNGLCVAHAAKAKYASDPAVREARKAASTRYAAKMRKLREEKAKLEAAKAAAQAE